jgi:hypothetical protein
LDEEVPEDEAQLLVLSAARGVVGIDGSTVRRAVVFSDMFTDKRKRG